jgi:hypothetical protein
VKICREGGAIIATGHAHNYARTVALEDMDEQRIASLNRSFVQLSRGDAGTTFVVVSGLGGIDSVVGNPTLSTLPYWAATYPNDVLKPLSLFLFMNIKL